MDTTVPSEGAVAPWDIVRVDFPFADQAATAAARAGYRGPSGDRCILVTLSLITRKLVWGS